MPKRPAPLIEAVRDDPQFRDRLHTIVSLYAHTRPAEARLALLDHLEELTLKLAARCAWELLEAGWRPDPPAEEPPAPLVNLRVGR